jgi:hypothetical protein
MTSVSAPSPSAHHDIPALTGLHVNKPEKKGRAFAYPLEVRELLV